MPWYDWSDLMPDTDCAALESRLANFAEGLHSLARDLREQRAAQVQLEETLLNAVAKLRDLSADVADHRRKAVEGLAVLGRELDERLRRCHVEAAELRNRIGAVEGLLADPRQMVARRVPPPDVRGVGEPIPPPPVGEQEGD